MATLWPHCRPINNLQSNLIFSYNIDQAACREKHIKKEVEIYVTAFEIYLVQRLAAAAAALAICVCCNKIKFH